MAGASQTTSLRRLDRAVDEGGASEFGRVGERAAALGSSGAKEVEIIRRTEWGVRGRGKQAKVRWSLSRLTLTHELARVIAIEQITGRHIVTVCRIRNEAED